MDRELFGSQYVMKGSGKAWIDLASMNVLRLEIQYLDPPDAGRRALTGGRLRPVVIQRKNFLDAQDSHSRQTVPNPKMPVGGQYVAEYSTIRNLRFQCGSSISVRLRRFSHAALSQCLFAGSDSQIAVDFRNALYNPACLTSKRSTKVRSSNGSRVAFAPSGSLKADVHVGLRSKQNKENGRLGSAMLLASRSALSSVQSCSVCWIPRTSETK